MQTRITNKMDLDQSWDEFLEIMPKWVEKRNK